MANMNFNIYHYAAENGLGWVVSKNQIAYLRPAFLMETVLIDSTLLRVGEKEVFVEMKMFNEAKTKLKSVLWSNFVHINMKTQRPENHSAEMIKKFKPFENPLQENLGFDERVDQLRSLI